MAKKDFSAALATSTQNKKESNLQLEVNRLKEDKIKLFEKIKDLENGSIQEDNQANISFLKISELKLGSNIRIIDEHQYDYENIKELADDIIKNNQLQPILISLDNYIIAGFRRFKALQLINKKDKSYDEILVCRYAKNYSDILPDELTDIQLAENQKRRDIDNFALSKLYNDLIEQNYDQKAIAERFKKSKSFVSKVVSINNIAPELVKLLKQFQVFGWSEKKLNAFNFEENGSEAMLKELEKNTGIIGILPLCAIGKHEENYEEQAKVFLKKYSSRLSEEDLKDEFFNDIKITKDEKTFSEQGLKHIESITKLLNNQETKFDNNKEYEAIKTKIKELEKLLKKVTF